MKSIEERADRAIYEPTDGHPLKVCEVVAFAKGYELGATEQKIIDDERITELEKEKVKEYSKTYKECNTEIKYNIWHIDAYTGYDDFYRNVYFPTPLNHHIDFIANATLTKSDIYEMFRDRHRGSRVIVIDKCYIVASGVITYEHKESL